MRDHELYAGGRRALRAGGEPSAVRRAGGGAAAGAGHGAAHGQVLPELRSAGRSGWGTGRWGGRANQAFSPGGGVPRTRCSRAVTRRSRPVTRSVS